MHISKELKDIRELLSLTQEDLVSIIGVLLYTISRLENEKRNKRNYFFSRKIL